MINLTSYDLTKASTAQLREIIKFEVISRAFKVNGRQGVEVGKPNDVLVEYADGVRGILTKAEFDAAYEVVHAQTAKEYLKSRGLDK